MLRFLAAQATDWRRESADSRGGEDRVTMAERGDRFRERLNPGRL